MTNAAEFILKLNTANFMAGVEAAKAGFKSLSGATSGLTPAQVNIRALEKATENLAASTARAKMHLSQIGVAMLAAGGVAAVAAKSYSDFAQKMAEIQTLGGSSAAVSSLSVAIRQTSVDMGKSATETAGAVYEIISSGVALEDSIGVVQLATKSAVAGVSDVQSTAKVGLAVINAYGLGVGKLENIYDVLFQTVKDGVTTLPELSQHLGEILPTAAAAGVGIESVSAAVATMTKVGIRTPQAVTALNGAIRSLSTPTVEAKAKMEELGIVWKGLIPTLETLKQKNLSMAQMRELIPDIEASKGILALTNNFDGLKKSADGMKNSAGAMQGAYAIMAETPQQKLENFMAAIQELGLQLGQVVVQFQPMIIAATDWAKGFAALPEPIKEIGLALTVAGVSAVAFRGIIMDVIKINSAMKAVDGLTKAGQALAFIGPMAPGVTATAAATTGLAGSVTAAGVAARGALVAFGPLALVLGAIAAVVYVVNDYVSDSTAKFDRMVKSAENVSKISKTFDDLKTRIKAVGAETSVWAKEMQDAKLKLMRAAAAGENIESPNVQKIIAEYEGRVKKIEGLNKTLLEHQTALGALEVEKKKSALAAMTAEERVYAQNVKNLSGETLQKRISDLQSLVDKTKQSLEQAKNEEQKLASDVANLQNQKATSAASAEDKIREIKRKGMTEEEALVDVKKQFNEKIRASDDALSRAKITGLQTDFNKSKDLAMEAANLATQLTGSDEEETRKAQIAGIKEAEKAKQEAIDAEIAMAQKQQALAADKIATIDKELGKLNELLTAAKTQVVINFDANIDAAKTNIEIIQNQLDRLKDKTVTVTVQQVEGHSAGGVAGFTRGGRFAGFGGGDKIPVLAEQGEWFINKFAVRDYGDDVMDVFNRRLVPPSALRAFLFGQRRMEGGPALPVSGLSRFVDSYKFPVIDDGPVLRRAAGGQVPAPAETFRIEFGRHGVTTTSDRQAVRGLLDALKREVGRA